MGATLPLRAWTAEEHEQMAAAGVLGEDDRVELIEGEIVQMVPAGARHAASVDALARLLQRQRGDRVGAAPRRLEVGVDEALVASAS